jgi:hypothetical protein
MTMSRNCSASKIRIEDSIVIPEGMAHAGALRNNEAKILPHRGKTFCSRHRPGLAESRVIGAIDQLARTK